MKTKFVMAMIIMISLILANMAYSQDVLYYVSSVRIYVDGFICATCVTSMENSLMQESSVVGVKGNLEEGTLDVTPKMDGSFVSLYDYEQRINSSRQYSVLKMEVRAVGRVVKFPAEYYTGNIYAYTGDRYRLEAGKTSFILTKNEKLDELLNSNYKTASVDGVVTSFRAREPIMEIQNFQQTMGETATQGTEQMIPEQISTVTVFVDGFICATCANNLEARLAAVGGVAKVDSDIEKGTLTITPAPGVYGKNLYLSTLQEQVNASREYTTRKMDVVAVGHVNKVNTLYFRAEEYFHSHDRYMLEIGDSGTRFILSEGNMLNQLIQAGYKKIKVWGTVTAFSSGVPILVMTQFEEAGKGTKSITDKGPSEAIRASLVDDKRFASEIKDHKQIDSIRLYVDGFICAACVESLHGDVLDKEGVDVVRTAPEAGLIDIIPKNVEKFNLYSLWSHINSTREYKVLKMDIVASGRLMETNVTYDQGTFKRQTVKRYMLVSGENIRFVLSENENLKEMIKSGDKEFTIVGTITSFNAFDPILSVESYIKLEEIPDWLKLLPGNL